MKFLKTFFAGLMLLSFGAEADILDQTARNEHMRYCLSQGGQRNICLCSYDKAKTVFSTSEMLDLTRKLAQRLPANSDKVSLLGKITARCVRDLQGKGQQEYEEYDSPSGQQSEQPANYNPVALPVPPPPPELGAQPKQIEPPVIDEPKKSAPRKYRRINSDETNVTEEEYLQYMRSQPGLNSAHFSEYNKIFFDSVQRGDVQGLIAGSNDIKNFNIKNEQGYTPLMVAVIYGQEISAEFLLERGAKLDEKNSQGQTALAS